MADPSPYAATQAESMGQAFGADVALGTGSSGGRMRPSTAGLSVALVEWEGLEPSAARFATPCLAASYTPVFLPAALDVLCRFGVVRLARSGSASKQHRHPDHDGLAPLVGPPGPLDLHVELVQILSAKHALPPIAAAPPAFGINPGDA